MNRTDSRNGRGGLVLAMVAVGLGLLIPFLPLHLISEGQFGSGLQPQLGSRLFVAALIRLFTPPTMSLLGLVLMAKRRESIASGVLLATSVLYASMAVTAPLFALPRAMPLLLAALESIVACLLLAAARPASRPAASEGHSLPPPPDPHPGLDPSTGQPGVET